MPETTTFTVGSASVELDKDSVEHWSQYGLDPATVLEQTYWEDGGKYLSQDARLDVVRRLYERNNPHLYKHPLQSAHEEFMDAFHSEVSRLIEED